MKANRIWTALIPAVLFLLIPALHADGQPPRANETKPTFTAAQKAALTTLFDHGGILIHLDEQQPGQPLVMVDFASHPEFSDDWLKQLLPFPELKVVRLAGTTITDAGLEHLTKIPKLAELSLNETPITDAGLITLAACKQLRVLNLQGTKVTSAGMAALLKALPQVTLIAKPDKELTQAGRGTDPTAAGAEVVKRFTAQEIKEWRKPLKELGSIPEGTPNGWSKSRVDPAKMLTVFPELKMRPGYVLRAYVFVEDGNSNGFVWALPANADFPAPNDCPRLESHFLKPPKPFDALDDLMEVVVGDDSPESYLHASILRRELREFGGGWHGIKWGMNTVLDASPWQGALPAADEPMTDRPTSKPYEWKWRTPQPLTWSPEVRVDQKQAVVTFYSYTPLMAEQENGEVEKERIILHIDTYRRGNYRPLVVEKKLAEGPNVVAF